MLYKNRSHVLPSSSNGAYTPAVVFLLTHMYKSQAKIAFQPKLALSQAHIGERVDPRGIPGIQMAKLLAADRATERV